MHKMSSVHLRLFDAMVFLICPAMCLSLPIWCYGISPSPALLPSIMSCSPAMSHLLPLLVKPPGLTGLLLSHICSLLGSSLLAWPVCCYPTNHFITMFGAVLFIISVIDKVNASNGGVKWMQECFVSFMAKLSEQGRLWLLPSAGNSAVVPSWSRGR